MTRPTDEDITALLFKIERWKSGDSWRDAGLADLNFNEGVMDALRWVLGESVEPIMRLD